MFGKTFQAVWTILATGTVLASCYFSNASHLVTLGSFFGIVFVILVAFKNQYANLFGALLAIVFGYLSYNAGYFTNAAVNILFSAPMGLFGWWYWTKHKNDATKSLTKAEIVLGLSALIISAGIGVSAALMHNSAHPFVDGISGILPIFATILLVLRYKEQWYLWIPYNAMEVFLWFSAASLAPEVLSIFVMRVIFLVNSCIGYFQWKE